MYEPKGVDNKLQPLLPTHFKDNLFVRQVQLGNHRWKNRSKVPGRVSGFLCKADQ